METRCYSASQNLNEGHILNFYKGKEKKYVGVFNVLTLKSGVDILGVRETGRAASAKLPGVISIVILLKSISYEIFFLNRIELTGVSFMLISDA